MNQLLKKIKAAVQEFQFHGSHIVTVSLVSNFSLTVSGTAQLSPSGSVKNNTELSKQIALYFRQLVLYRELEKPFGSLPIKLKTSKHTWTWSLEWVLFTLASVVQPWAVRTPLLTPLPNLPWILDTTHSFREHYIGVYAAMKYNQCHDQEYIQAIQYFMASRWNIFRFMWCTE